MQFDVVSIASYNGTEQFLRDLSLYVWMSLGKLPFYKYWKMLVLNIQDIVAYEWW